MKIALALIVKGDDSEAVLLDRCLENIKPFVDGIFVTSTYKKGEQPNKLVENVAKLHKTNLSTFEWCNDFAKARNFNFSQVPKEYDYILWCDADDVYRGLEKLKPTIEENPQTDAFAFWYMYEFDNEKQPTVVHKKTMVIKNDGCAEWKGAIHEDLMPTRIIDTKFVTGIDRMHFTNEERIETARQRNVEVSEKALEENPNDAHSYFNLGNSLIGIREYDKAKQALEKFMDLSNSDDEKYIAQMRIASIIGELSKEDQTKRGGAIRAFQMAIGMQPQYSDAYLQLGQLYFSFDDMDNAEQYILQGIVKKPPYHNIIVYNPRDYDYNPMSLLAKVYYRKNRPDLALPLLAGCLKIYPNNKELKKVVKELTVETKRLEKVLKTVQRLNKLEDPKKIKAELKKVPKDLQSHPAVCAIRNKYFVKETSSGKDITYYCGQTTHEWNPEMAKTKGIGGSEEAVINLSKEWVKLGYNVTVYNSCGTERMLCDGVTYKPFWEFNNKDKTDILILWRHPKLLDYELNAGKVYIDMHDVIGKGEFNEKRIEKLDKVFVKTNFHRSLFPNIPDEKIMVIENGLSLEGAVEVKKDPYLIINTSSPDRAMGITPKLFKEIKKQVPEAKMFWAYGFDIFDNAHSDNKQMMDWKNKTLKEIEESGIENLGRLSQSEVAKLYQKASIFFYPTEFAEIHCISVCKAQMANCFPITTDFGALNETNRFGIKIHSDKTKDNWSVDGKIHFGVESEKTQKELIDAVVKQLKNPIKIEDTKDFREWKKYILWESIAKNWLQSFSK